MKKNKTQDREQKQQPNRLRLKRETIQILDPVLLELAEGGLMLSTVDSCDTATSSDTGC
jgi:hypothetical protein